MLLSKEVITKNTVGYGLLSREKLSNHSIFGPSYAPDPFTLVFTSSQTWVVPDGVDKVDVTVVGGGGGTSQGSSVDGHGGGGGGYVTNQTNVTVTPGSNIIITVGAGTAGNGGQSKFGAITANGGNFVWSTVGGDGGSGGGGGGYYRESGSDYSGADGGTNGSNGQTKHGTGSPGTGQGTTTIGVNSVRYAGGGGGSGTNMSEPGAGGDGGGGAGGSTLVGYNKPGTAGTTNTGGGAGGSYVGSGTVNVNGGSGIVIVKWNG